MVVFLVRVFVCAIKKCVGIEREQFLMRKFWQIDTKEHVNPFDLHFAEVSGMQPTQKQVKDTRNVLLVILVICCLLSLHIAFTTKFFLVPIFFTFSIFGIILYLRCIPIVFCCSSVFLRDVRDINGMKKNAGLDMIAYALRTHRLPVIVLVFIYLQIIIFLLCVFMITAYEFTGWYIDISTYANILHIFPYLWDYSGNTITQEPYGLANTIYVIVYYSVKYVFLPFWFVYGIVSFLQWHFKIKHILNTDNGKVSQMIQNIEQKDPKQFMKKHKFMDGVIAIFALLFVLWVFTLSFHESDPMGYPFTLMNGAYTLSYSLFMVLAAFMFFLVGMFMIPMKIITLYYYQKFLQKLKENNYVK